uniref:Uncharacterized protein n=1 Tax=Anguilla anguilla TaxID=7936 RepID=A0A0E9TBT8_ANGAN
MGTHGAFSNLGNSLINTRVCSRPVNCAIIGEHCNLYVPFPLDLWLFQRAGIGRQLKR